MENEYIVAPAIRKDNKIRISRFSHAEMIGCDCFFKGAEQGFITNLDRFVDRKEALKIAEKNNKGLNKFYKSDELYSEDLFKTEFKLVKENSIEEGIKILENFINWLKTDFEYNSGEEIKAIEHILSDYKRVLKENGILKEEKNKLGKSGII